MWQNEPADNHDTIEWAAAQDWSNGKVGLYGSSYSGANQWMALKDKPPSLRTIIPAGTSMSGFDMPLGGVPNAHVIVWSMLTSGKPTHWNLFAAPGFWTEKLTELRRSGRSFADLPRAFGVETESFREQIEHPQWGEVWERHLPSPEDLRAVDFPVLSVTGQNDSALIGTLENWRRFHAAAPESAGALGHLVIGPWFHGGMEGSVRAGELAFGPAAAINLQQVKFDWYHWTLGSGPRPDFVARPVTYYVCGEESWQTADTLAGVSGEPLEYHLTSNGRADDVHHSGQLSETSHPAGHDSFTIDLDDITKIRIERQQRPDSAGPGAAYGVPFPPPHHSMFAALYGDDPTDQSFTTDLQGMGVVYHSAPFAHGPTLAGRPTLDLWLRMDVPDADLCVFLHEIRCDASAILLSSTLRRLRFRNGWDAPEFASPNVPFRLRLDDFRFFARRLADGSRLRLTIRALSGLNFEANAEMRQPGGARIANVDLLHGGNTASKLTLNFSSSRTADPAT